MSDLSVNEFGTVISVYRCRFCVSTFTVCPAQEPERADQWTGCLADTCPSYDPLRDIDVFFEAAADGGLIERRQNQ